METIHLVVVGENTGEARATKELEGYQDGVSKQENKFREQKQRHRCQKRQRHGQKPCMERRIHKVAGDLDRWLKGQTVDREMGQWISKHAQNISRAAGVARSTLYQTDKYTIHPSIILSAFQNYKKTYLYVSCKLLVP